MSNKKKGLRGRKERETKKKSANEKREGERISTTI